MHWACLPACPPGQCGRVEVTGASLVAFLGHLYVLHLLLLACCPLPHRYVEQTDIHIAQTTVQEALAFSAHLRLPTTVDRGTRSMFVEEVSPSRGMR